MSKFSNKSYLMRLIIVKTIRLLFYMKNINSAYINREIIFKFKTFFT